MEAGGALAVSRSEDPGELPLPRDVTQLVRLINQLRRNDRVYILATAEDRGFVLGTARLPNPTPSAAALLAAPRGHGALIELPWRGLFEEALPTTSAVEGVARAVLEVEEP